jgi:hypothetical protein
MMVLHRMTRPPSCTTWQDRITPPTQHTESVACLRQPWGFTGVLRNSLAGGGHLRGPTQAALFLHSVHAPCGSPVGVCADHAPGDNAQQGGLGLHPVLRLDLHGLLECGVLRKVHGYHQ